MISFTGVTKTYNKHFGLKNVTFEIAQNDVVLFIGENGSGKSTCIKLIAKTMFLNKNDTGYITNTFEKIAYLPEKFNLPSLISTKDLLSLFCSLNNSKINQEEILNRYNVPNKLICNLSKGMFQKLGIILTLSTPATLYLFDEPTDGLDKESRILFQNDISNLQSEGKTIIISTHNKSYFQEIKPISFIFQGGSICKKSPRTKN